MILNFLEHIETVIYRIPRKSFNNDLALYVFLILLSVVLYAFVIWALLFKSRWIIEKLSLEKHFEQEIVIIKADSTAVIQIAIIVLGGLTFIYALPLIFSNSFIYLEGKQTSKVVADFNVSDYFNEVNLSLLIFAVCKLILGFLLVVYNKRLTLWLERKSNKKLGGEPENTLPGNSEVQ